MKIAYLLYGQPRDYNDGYKNINEFLFSENKDIEVDFFFHCWLINENEKYKVSPWRKIENKYIEYNNSNSAKNDLIDLYKPIRYEFETQKEFENNIPNENNILSQMYSRNKVRNLFKTYVNDKVNYDFVIMSRFDNITSMPKINFKHLNKNVYVDKMHIPRKIFPDNLIIMQQDTCIKWFDIYDKLNIILTTIELNEKVKLYNENIILNSE